MIDVRARLDDVLERHALRIDADLAILRRETRRSIAWLEWDLARRLREIEDDTQRAFGPWYARGEAGLRWFRDVTGYDARQVLVGPGARSLDSPAAGD